MYIYIPLAIIGISLIIIIIIIVRKFSNLAAIDINSIPQERQSEVKDQILIDRLKRKTGGIFSRPLDKLKSLQLVFKNKLLRFYEYLLELEKKYQKNAKTQIKENGEDIDQKIARLLREAEDLVKDENLPEAEKRYVEVISLDVKNADAYEGLGKLYLLGKDYEQAKETFEYLLKIEPEVSEYYLELGETHKALENYEKALVNAEKAVELSPNNPRLLDFLIEVAIMVGNKKLAENTLEKLKEVNPENEKLNELKEKIKELK